MVLHNEELHSAKKIMHSMFAPASKKVLLLSRSSVGY